MLLLSLYTRTECDSLSSFFHGARESFHSSLCFLSLFLIVWTCFQYKSSYAHEQVKFWKTFTFLSCISIYEIFEPELPICLIICFSISFSHLAKSFSQTFFLTLHPQIWISIYYIGNLAGSNLWVSLGNFSVDMMFTLSAPFEPVQIQMDLNLLNNLRSSTVLETALFLPSDFKFW